MFATVLVDILCGCVRSQPSYGVKPGDVDFPRENPTPTREFQLEAILPPRIAVRFKSVYSASLPADTKPGEVPPCHYVTDTGRVLPFSVLVPLQLKFEKDDPELGEYYGGMVAVDRYLPGRCRWELTGGMYSLDGDPKHDIPLFQYDKSLAFARDDPKTHECLRVPSSYRSSHPEQKLAPIVCATEGLTAAHWPNDFDAANLREDIAEVGNKTPYVSFLFWDRDNPLPRGVVNVALKPSPPPSLPLP